MIANFKANDFKANNISTGSYVFKFIRIFSREYFFIDYVNIQWKYYEWNYQSLRKTHK